MMLVAYGHGLRVAELVRSTSEQRPCTSAGSSRVQLARSLSLVTNSGRSGGYSANRSQNRPSSSRLSVEHRSRRLASLAWSSARAPKPGLGSRLTRTCSGTPAAMRSQIEDTIPERFKLSLVTATSSTLSATQNCRRRGSRISSQGTGFAAMTRQHESAKCARSRQKSNGYSAGDPWCRCCYP